ncbi:alpha/beta fold hydrolase [Specibacter cremeus]|uniref:alpha/beta fold hydrolase n=1 Tax=Specibacter cremeus TaxID=1629051 RepID=UPI000F79B874|nr:alpha/beta hydrolase [Specibacter cremeus]
MSEPASDAATTGLWYAQRGDGEALVLLHPGGAGVDSRALTPQFEALSHRFHVYTPEQRAHGRTPDVEGPLSYELMAQDTIAFIDSIVGHPAHLLGISDGAVVALTVALRRPDLVRRLVLVAGVFHYDGWLDGVLDGDPPSFLRQSYTELTPDGANHYDVVVAKLAAMHACQPTLTTEDLQKVQSRTLVMVADDDQVRLEHALELYRNLRNAEFAVIPGTSHGLLVEKPDLCNLIVSNFLGNDPVPTFAPIRRATDSTS